MWAQGLTIGIILSAAGFKANHNKGESASMVRHGFVIGRTPF
jgi:hypothetical protein